MTKATASKKLKIVERILAIDNPATLKHLEMALEDILTPSFLEDTLPAGAIIALAEGHADLLAGRVHSMEEAIKAMNRGMARGLANPVQEKMHA